MYCLSLIGSLVNRFEMRILSSYIILSLRNGYGFLNVCVMSDGSSDTVFARGPSWGRMSFVAGPPGPEMYPTHLSNFTGPRRLPDCLRLVHMQERIVHVYEDLE